MKESCQLMRACLEDICEFEGKVSEDEDNIEEMNLSQKRKVEHLTDKELEKKSKKKKEQTRT